MLQMYSRALGRNLGSATVRSLVTAKKLLSIDRECFSNLDSSPETHEQSHMLAPMVYLNLIIQRSDGTISFRLVSEDCRSTLSSLILNVQVY